MTGDSELPRDEQGRFYHLDCGDGDIAPYVLAFADPTRAGRVAETIGGLRRMGHRREYVIFTGTYKQIPVTLLGTGIGAPATAIAVVEAVQCQPDATFIRLGTCGALQSGMEIGDLVITERVIRDENTTHHYADPRLPVEAHPDVVQALQEAAEELKVPFHKGITCTTSDFYAGQGRVVPGFPTREPTKVKRFSTEGVLNFEMEMSVFLTLAQVCSFNVRAGGMTVVAANRVDKTWVTPGQLAKCEENCVSTGLKALEILAGMDNRRT